MRLRAVSGDKGATSIHLCFAVDANGCERSQSVCRGNPLLVYIYIHRHVDRKRMGERISFAICRHILFAMCSFNFVPSDKATIFWIQKNEEKKQQRFHLRRSELDKFHWNFPRDNSKCLSRLMCDCKYFLISVKWIQCDAKLLFAKQINWMELGASTFVQKVEMERHWSPWSWTKIISFTALPCALIHSNNSDGGSS